MNRPLVSIVITCYNYAEYIEAAIESVKSQTYDNIELIVIDDGSTDDTEKVLKKISSKFKFKHVTQENRGIIKTRNKALSLVEGEYIIQLDADDVLDLNYVQETLKYLRSKEVDIVYTNYSLFRDSPSKSFEISDFPEFDLEILKNVNFIHMASMVRTSVAKKYKFDENLTELSHEDWDFFLNMCLHGSRAVLCKTTMLHYRSHDESRNNKLSSELDRSNYAKMHSYIANKYSAIFQKEYKYTTANMFAIWYLDLVEKRAKQAKELESVKSQLELIKLSRVWRFRNAIAKCIGSFSQVYG